jgi:3D (Asp-Asp-Asp) domain-containing protein
MRENRIIDGLVQILAGLLGIFFLASNQAFSKERVEDKKTHPQAVTVYARSTFYNKDEVDCDSDTKKKKTATCINIATVEARGLGVVAVDPSLIPYGSTIIAPNGKIFIAVDTGGDVRTRKAAKELADIRGFNPKSLEYRAPVLDFYSYRQIGQAWDHFHVIPYREDRPFTDLKQSEKIRYLDMVSRMSS